MYEIISFRHSPESLRRDLLGTSSGHLHISSMIRRQCHYQPQNIAHYFYQHFEPTFIIGRLLYLRLHHTAQFTLLLPLPLPLPVKPE